jgi:hypothetical protein
MLMIWLSILISLPAFAKEGGVEIDALLAKVGREAVLLSDLQRFSDVDKVLSCAGVVKREKPLPTERKALLDAYVNEELLYQEARAKKTSTSGQIPLSVQAILAKEGCRTRWLALGERYSKIWRTEVRIREGEAHLVRELEKRVLVERFRRNEVIPDVELWKREANVRYPVKIYLE